MEFHHISVLLKETLEGLAIQPDGIYVDCTLGGGGHARAIGERLSPQGVLIGFDQDEMARRAACERLQGLSCQVMIIPSNFENLKEELEKREITNINGFIFDLGVSSYQLDTPMRGFSYMQDGPLDMRMNQEQVVTAEMVVNEYSFEELHRIIKEYGEERWAKRIAQFIVEERAIHPIKTTYHLVDVIKKAIPAKARQDGPHPAKRTFQAIRIEVNKELEILWKTFEDAAQLLVSGGRLCVITFHSLEDRITKQVFKALSQGCICPPSLPVCMCEHKAIVKAKNKAIEPSEEEITINPRSRSAKLRVAEKL